MGPRGTARDPWRAVAGVLECQALHHRVVVELCAAKRILIDGRLLVVVACDHHQAVADVR